MWVMNQFQAMGGYTIKKMMEEQKLMFAATSHLFYNLDLLGALTDNKVEMPNIS
jgi:proteasome assembly chaperone (PAC2) family protein